jgi:hypothetical protein
MNFMRKSIGFHVGSRFLSVMLDKDIYEDLVKFANDNGLTVNEAFRQMLFRGVRLELERLREEKQQQEQHHASNHHLPAVGHDLDDQQLG